MEKNQLGTWHLRARHEEEPLLSNQLWTLSTGLAGGWSSTFAAVRSMGSARFLGQVSFGVRRKTPRLSPIGPSAFSCGRAAPFQVDGPARDCHGALGGDIASETCRLPLLAGTGRSELGPSVPNSVPESCEALMDLIMERFALCDGKVQRGQ